jgi:hypothetical protein
MTESVNQQTQVNPTNQVGHGQVPGGFRDHNVQPGNVRTGFVPPPQQPPRSLTHIKGDWDNTRNSPMPPQQESFNVLLKEAVVSLYGDPNIYERGMANLAPEQEEAYGNVKNSEFGRMLAPINPSELRNLNLEQAIAKIHERCIAIKVLNDFLSGGTAPSAVRNVLVDRITTRMEGITKFVHEARAALVETGEKVTAENIFGRLMANHPNLLPNPNVHNQPLNNFDNLKKFLKDKNAANGYIDKSSLLYKILYDGGIFIEKDGSSNAYCGLAFNPEKSAKMAWTNKELTDTTPNRISKFFTAIGNKFREGQEDDAAVKEIERLLQTTVAIEEANSLTVTMTARDAEGKEIMNSAEQPLRTQTTGLNNIFKELLNLSANAMDNDSIKKKAAETGTGVKAAIRTRNAKKGVYEMVEYDKKNSVQLNQVTQLTQKVKDICKGWNAIQASLLVHCFTLAYVEIGSLVAKILGRLRVIMPAMPAIQPPRNPSNEMAKLITALSFINMEVDQPGNGQ